MSRRYIVFFVAGLSLLICGTVCSAAVFDYMTYQAVLEKDGARVEGPTNLIFRIYNASSGDTLKWQESRTDTIHNGILNIVLGEVNSMSDELEGTEQYWLEIWVEGALLGPRVKLTAVPYSMNANKLDGQDASAFASSAHNHDAAYINDGAGEINATNDFNFTSSTFITNLDADKLDGQHASAFSQLGNSIESGEITDGTIQTGDLSGSIQIPNADKVDGYDASTTPGPYILYPLNSSGRFSLEDNSNLGLIGGYNSGSGEGIRGYSYGEDGAGVYGRATSSGGVGVWGDGLGDGGGVRGECNAGYGVYAQSLNGYGLVALSRNGYAAYAEGRSWFTERYTKPTVLIENNRSSGYADALEVTAPHSNSEATYALHVSTAKGFAIVAEKTYNDERYVIDVRPAGDYQNALRAWGNFLVVNGTKSAAVKTSVGYEPLFCVESPEVEFYSDGTAQLTHGEASVDFDRLFSEAISPDIPIRVVVTPVGSWSGIYLQNATNSGFAVRSEAGDLNATFNWIAIGRRKGYERTPEITVPSLQEMESLRQQKESMRQSIIPDVERLEGIRQHKESVRRQK
jgi:hypothetical protein